MYELTYGFYVKTSDSGAGSSCSLVVDYTSLSGSTSAEPLTFSLNSCAGYTSTTNATELLAGTPVLYALSGGAPYGNASVDIFVSALRR